MNVKEFFLNNDKCCGCMACTSVCPKNALTVKESKDGFLYPALNTDLCISCGKCVNICPVEKNEELKQNVLDVYGAKAKDTEILKNSQSGGIGFLLGKSIIEQGGTVYGAVLCEDLVTRHKRCETIEELHKTQGSKYVQSYIDKELYRQIEADLKSDKKVLFTGTPCQCAGVKSLLGKYENLYMADLICHGIMSPGFVKSYIKAKEKSKKKKIVHIDYRTNKNVTWGSGSVFVVVYKDNTEECFKDYSTVFLKNLLLRKSCYECRFANINRNSDITIGDFWGVKKLIPDFYNEKGVSVIIVNSDKGLLLFDRINSETETVITDIASVSKFNSRLIKPMGKIKNRNLYSFIFDKFGFSGVYFYYRLSVKTNQKINNFKAKIKRIINR